MSARAIASMIERCGRLMIHAEDFDRRLHWWYRVQHYSDRRRRPS